MQVFDNTNLGSVRVTTNENNEPLFCLADVCRILDLKNPSQVKSRLDQAGCVSIDLNKLISSDGVSINMLGNSIATFVDESNFYDCVFDSVKPEAKAFRKWVTSEVLPQIRQTGGYIPIAQEEYQIRRN
ncbi:MAG: BRO family protein [Bacteroidales bacterium]|nr:BRO family protein [Bacteroidales bacterium]MDD4684849.1 BRO family protein [Bacteroidales bacterium]